VVLEQAGQAGQPLHILLPVLVAQLARHTLYAAVTRHTSDRSMTLRSSGVWGKGKLELFRHPVHLFFPINWQSLHRYTFYVAATRHTSDRSTILRSSGVWKKAKWSFFNFRLLVHLF
jgi:hypothetical protein